MLSLNTESFVMCLHATSRPEGSPSKSSMCGGRTHLHPETTKLQRAAYVSSSLPVTTKLRLHLLVLCRVVLTDRGIRRVVLRFLGHPTADLVVWIESELRHLDSHVDLSSHPGWMTSSGVALPSHRHQLMCFYHVHGERRDRLEEDILAHLHTLFTLFHLDTSHKILTCARAIHPCMNTYTQTALSRNRTSAHLVPTSPHSPSTRLCEPINTVTSGTKR